MQIVIGIKYCGGCNPHIDRTKLVQEIKILLPAEFIFTETTTKEQWNIGILVCGCPTACADKPDFKKLARKWIVIAGKSIDLDNMPEEELADIVVQKLKKLK